MLLAVVQFVLLFLSVVIMFISLDSLFGSSVEKRFAKTRKTVKEMKKRKNKEEDFPRQFKN